MAGRFTAKSFLYGVGRSDMSDMSDMSDRSAQQAGITVKHV
jgi:hypothetical protein